MKRFCSLVLALLLCTLCACGRVEDDIPAAEPEPQDTTLELWVYPIGQWADPSAVDAFLDGFHQKNPNLFINVTYLDNNTGDAMVRSAMESWMTPDLLLGNRKPLVTQWADSGMLVDLSDLTRSAGIYENVLTSCQGGNGKTYLLPLCVDVYCTAFNRTIFTNGDVIRFADLSNRTWNTSDYFDAEISLFGQGYTDFASLYCADQNGDSSTRAFISQLYYGGLYTEDGTGYTFNNDKNLKAFQKLLKYKGFRWDTTLLGEDAAYLFATGLYDTTLYWNIDLARSYDTQFPAEPMSYPTHDGAPAQLPGEVWGFSVFNNNDENRLEGARAFLRYLYDADYTQAVMLSGYFSARDGYTMYADDELMASYEQLSRYIAPEPSEMGNWMEMRTAWREMLTTIGTTENITSSGIRDAMIAFEKASNK